MAKGLTTNYVKRTQRDYSKSFKLQVVNEIERGELSKTGTKKKYGIQGDSTVKKWLIEYGNFDWENQIPTKLPKTTEQRILELESKVKLLKKQNKRLEKQVDHADKKSILI